MANVTGSVFQVDEERVRSHVEEAVRSSVESTLNDLLEAEADQVCGACRFVRAKARDERGSGDAEGSVAAEFAV